jgi:hypothetical protein
VAGSGHGWGGRLEGWLGSAWADANQRGPPSHPLPGKAMAKRGPGHLQPVLYPLASFWPADFRNPLPVTSSTQNLTRVQGGEIAPLR